LRQDGGVKPIAVHHVSINVSDVDAALVFYVDRLGLVPRTDRPDFGFPGAWLDAGNQQIHQAAG
jgi:catechol 2,3-dioxygenase-like lactoylglutathione lyase family enzyme